MFMQNAFNLEIIVIFRTGQKSGEEKVIFENVAALSFTKDERLKFAFKGRDATKKNYGYDLKEIHAVYLGNTNPKNQVYP